MNLTYFIQFQIHSIHFSDHNPISCIRLLLLFVFFYKIRNGKVVRLITLAEKSTVYIHRLEKSSKSTLSTRTSPDLLPLPKSSKESASF